MLLVWLVLLLLLLQHLEKTHLLVLHAVPSLYVAAACDPP